MQRECAWQAQLVCLGVFKKKNTKAVWGLNLYILKCILKTASLLYMLWHELRTYFNTFEALPINLFTAKACLHQGVPAAKAVAIPDWTCCLTEISSEVVPSLSCTSRVPQIYLLQWAANRTEQILKVLFSLKVSGNTRKNSLWNRPSKAMSASKEENKNLSLT